MKFLRTGYLAASLLLAPMPLNAASPEAAREVLDLIGYDTYAAFVAQSFEGAPDAADGALSPEVARRWSDIVAGRIDVDSIFDQTVAAVAEEMSDDDVSSLISFFSGDLGKRVTAAEEATQDVSDPEALAAAQGAYLATLDDSFRDRFDLYAEMIDAMDAVDSGTTLAMNVNFAMISGMVASGLMETVPSDAEILSMIAEGEDEIRAAVFGGMIESMAYTYRDISDEDMRTYADVLNSPAGRKLYRISERVSNGIIIEAAREIGHEVMVQMGKRDL